MDYLALALTGVISGFAGVSGGLFVFGALKGRLKTMIFEATNDYVAATLAEIEKDPSKIAKRFHPVIGSLMQTAMGDAGIKAPKPMHIKQLGITIPPELYIPIGQRIAERFLGKTGEKLIEEGTKSLLG